MAGKLTPCSAFPYPEFVALGHGSAGITDPRRFQTQKQNPTGWEWSVAVLVALSGRDEQPAAPAANPAGQPYADCVICPKCQGSLRTVDRKGVRLEQCENCQGIFLDRGELEQILQAEQRYYGGAPPYAPPPHAGVPQGGHWAHPDSPPYSGGYGGHYPDSPRPYGHQGHRRRSFLGDLFG